MTKVTGIGGVFCCLVAICGALAADQDLAQDAAREALGGEWIFFEDRTEERALERMGPPMSAKFALRVEEDAVVLVYGHGSGHRDVRVALDGSIVEVEKEGRITRYRGGWDEGVLTYEVGFVRREDEEPDWAIRRRMQVGDDGLVVRNTYRESESVGLYRHAEDIPLPELIEAGIGDLDWLAGAWVATRGASGATTIEERWGPPAGGAMLGTSRTVRRGRMSAFEYLRIVERDGGLVYVTQPNGGAATEFLLTELSERRAVFDNPRHDYPKRITYTLGDEGGLVATIGFLVGGTPGRFEYQREGLDIDR